LAKQQYDTLTEEYFSDPKLIWQHTISGEKHFDSSDFLGALKDLSPLQNWKSAFFGMSGLEAFFKKTDSFFELNGDLSSDDTGRQYLYFSPINSHTTSAKVIKLMTQHLGESAKLAELNGDKEWADKFSTMPVEWIEPNNLIRNNPDNETEAYLWDTWGDTYADNKKSNWSHFHYCLQEACYGLAADYSLQHFLMQEFYDLDLNLEYQYNLKWLHGGCYFFADRKCYVSTKEGR